VRSQSNIVFNTVRLLLIVAVIVLAVIWYRGRDRRVLAALGGAAGALALLFLITGVVRLVGGKTDEELIKDALKEMAAGVQAQDLDRIFAHVSDSFDLDNTTTKPMLREFARRKLDNGEVTDILVWEFSNAVVTPARDGVPATATIHFKVKPKAEGIEGYWECDAVFVKEPDGQWRLKSFKIYLPQHKDPMPVPGLN
jgi:ketosteroid isomerase-like protein